MRFLMLFLVRFRVQNAPYPTLHEYLFREASRGLERKLSHIISRHHSFQFLLNWRYSVAELRDYKPVRGRLWQVLFSKSHQNRMKNRMCNAGRITLRFWVLLRFLLLPLSFGKATDYVDYIRTRNRHILGFARSLSHGNIAGPITDRMLVLSSRLHASVIWGLQLGNARFLLMGSTHSLPPRPETDGERTSRRTTHNKEWSLAFSCFVNESHSFSLHTPWWYCCPLDQCPALHHSQEQGIHMEYGPPDWIPSYERR